MMVGTPLAYWRTHDPLWLVVWLIVDKAQLPRFGEGLGRLVLQGIGPSPAYLVAASPVIGMGPSTPSPLLRVRRGAVVRNI